MYDFYSVRRMNAHQTRIFVIYIDGLVKAVDLPKDTFCLACFTGDYPIPVQLEMDKLALESKPAEEYSRFGVK